MLAANAVLTARVADLEAKPKTPGNSSLPPSSGQKPSAPMPAKRKGKPHVGAHRPLHQTRRRSATCSHGFRSEWGAALYADIRSVVETARRRSIRAIDAIRLTLDRKPIPDT